ncbi:MAG: hypothetical protein GY844_15005 [Bradyrhizobium sp.]|nr:hypothetical protein [Bradyrhizobium sp.]
MRAATAYFAGVGTVAVAIAAGLGGGLLLGDIMSPQQPKYPSSEVTRLEQRSSHQPVQVTNSAPQPVPYMAAAQVANTVAEQPAPSPQPQQAPSQTQQAVARPTEPPKPSERSTPAQPVTATVQPPPSTERTAARTAPEDSFAKARESDVKNDARRAEDKRRAERRQQWADKRKWRQRGDDELGDVEASVREATESRSRSEPRQLFGRGPAFGEGRMTLFDD